MHGASAHERGIERFGGGRGEAVHAMHFWRWPRWGELWWGGVWRGRWRGREAMGVYLKAVAFCRRRRRLGIGRPRRPQRFSKKEMDIN
jgi:hypothetical protein